MSANQPVADKVEAMQGNVNENCPPLRFSRACRICLADEPRHLSVMTPCGHFICRGCALKMRFEAAELGQPLLCAVCRGEGRFVVMKEEVIQDERIAFSDAVADARTSVREVADADQLSIDDENKVLAEAAAASAAFRVAEDAYIAAEDACVAAKNETISICHELLQVCNEAARAARAVTYRCSRILPFLFSRPSPSRDEMDQARWHLYEVAGPAVQWQAAMYAADDRNRASVARSVHLKAIADAARVTLNGRQAEMIVKHDEVEAMVARMMRENEEISALGHRFARRCGACKMEPPHRRVFYPACGHAVCRECADMATASDADAKCPTCQTAGDFIPLFEELVEEGEAQ